MTMVETINPYLRGVYAPVADEITAENMQVIGEVPLDLNGVYVRNGPNPRFAPRGRYHWFDGDGMLHAVQIQNGKVTYRNRYIQTEGFQRESAAGQGLWTGLMEPMSNNPPDMFLKDTGNTDLVYFNRALLGLWYLAGKPYRVDACTLETQGIEDFKGGWKGNLSAHAKVDEHTGELLFFDYGPRPPYMTYGVANPDGSLAHLTAIDLPGSRSPHDMAITEHYSILMDLPLFAEPEALKKGRTKVVFHRNMPSRFGIIPRYGSREAVRWFEAEPCYIYHTINAWEEGDEIVMDGCRVIDPEPPDRGGSEIDRMLAYLRLDARLYRWRFNLKTGAVKEGWRDDENSEFPSINANYLGRASRYAYNVHISPEPTLLFDGLMKYDTDSGKSETFIFGPGRFGSEAPFAPRTNAKSEDDGYLVSFVHDEMTDTSELVILDAQNITDGPIARVIIPQRIPSGFHACWVPGEKLG